jgi:Uma2 family endonuclease
MATAFAPAPHAEDRTVLREISWDTYVRLCDENQSRSTQMAYFEGDLEIMTVGLMHESAKGRIHSLIDAIAESLNLDFENTGQPTFRHPRKRIGFEADLSYYFSNPEYVRGKTKLDLVKDPPPDLVVEVDVSRNSERKLLMYSTLGIREVWRYEGFEIRIYRLSSREYKTAARGAVFTGVSAALLTKLLSDAGRMNRVAWLKHVRKSVSAKKPLPHQLQRKLP